MCAAHVDLKANTELNGKSLQQNIIVGKERKTWKM